MWGLLATLLVATLAGLGFMLFRKAMRTAHALDALGRQLAAVDIDGDDRGGDGRGGAALPAFRSAVLQDPTPLRFAAEMHTSNRRHRRQVRRDELIAQGKLFTHAQMIQRTLPHAR
ncbi:hypothetical protein GY21_13875 [Cryobacterium roopkundense]|uniref:Uncharacterized protein n=2 Tax=Cryobacterium roopkundense TaxID=1001240 RepID=A0A099J590_9MICO|nr:hypothetical protein GY21_13875 [Cryobacterium roopkundense]